MLLTQELHTWPLWTLPWLEASSTMAGQPEAPCQAPVQLQHSTEPHVSAGRNVHHAKLLILHALIETLSYSALNNSGINDKNEGSGLAVAALCLVSCSALIQAGEKLLFVCWAQ